MPKYSLRIGGRKVPVATTDRRLSEAIGKDPAEITGTGLADVFGFEHTLLLRGLEVLQNE